MMRRRIAIVLGCSMLGAAGCDKPASQRARPELALASARLMPAELPHYEAVYFEDQTKVKVITGRTVSYEPLESFRAAKARAASEKGGVEKAPAKPRGVFGRSRAWLVEKLGGTAPAAGARTADRPVAPAEDSADDETDESDADESDAAEEEEADEGGEDDEAEDAEDEEDSEEDEDWGEDEEDEAEEDEGGEEPEADEEDSEEGDAEEEADTEDDEEEDEAEDDEENDQEEEDEGEGEDEDEDEDEDEEQ